MIGTSPWWVTPAPRHGVVTTRTELTALDTIESTTPGKQGRVVRSVWLEGAEWTREAVEECRRAAPEIRYPRAGT